MRKQIETVLGTERAEPIGRDRAGILPPGRVIVSHTAGLFAGFRT